MNIPPSLREPRPGRRDPPLEIYAMQAGRPGWKCRYTGMTTLKSC